MSQPKGFVTFTEFNDSPFFNVLKEKNRETSNNERSDWTRYYSSFLSLF